MLQAGPTQITPLNMGIREIDIGKYVDVPPIDRSRLLPSFELVVKKTLQASAGAKHIRNTIARKIH